MAIKDDMKDTIQGVGDAVDSMSGDAGTEPASDANEPPEKPGTEEPTGPINVKAAYDAIMKDPELSKGLKAAEDALGSRSMVEEMLERAAKGGMEPKGGVSSFALELSTKPPKGPGDLFAPMGRAMEKHRKM